MAYPGYDQKILENAGAGPLIQKELIPIKYYVGEISLYPFRVDELPDCVYFCNGDAWPLTSAVGAALNGLSTNYKADWGITVAGANISLPKLFDSDGNGYFPRPVDGTARLPGSKQGDAIRNIKTTAEDISGIAAYNAPLVSDCYRSASTEALYPPFYSVLMRYNNYVIDAVSGSKWRLTFLGFNAGLSVPTAEENRPANVGMIPGIYLGVSKNAA
jgi:hypothetical protein